ncbi:MAG: tail fiber domain-containing protein [Bacteroidetes bacterium]|nr:tail fiber domain-containing protein [Bacteroidota bacterium]
MKKVLYIILFFSVKVFSQSVTLEPGSNGFVSIPSISALPSASASDKGKVIFLTTDNKFYFCDGTNWSSPPFFLPTINTVDISAEAFWITNTNSIVNTSTVSAIRGDGVSHSNGVVGLTANANTAVNSNGIYGLNYGIGSFGSGVYGIHSGTGAGVKGLSTNGIAGLFNSTSGYGLQTTGKLRFGGSGIGTIAAGKVLKAINSSGDTEWDDAVTLPVSWSRNMLSGTVFQVENTDSSPSSGLGDVAIKGISNSIDGIGISGETQSGTGVKGVSSAGTAAYFNSTGSGYALKTSGKLSFSGSGVGTIAAGKVLRATNNLGDAEWAEPIAFPYVGSGISGVIATPLFQINNNQGASGGVAIKGVSSSVGVWGEIPSSVSGVGDAVYGINNNTVFGGSGVRGAHTANGTGGSFFSQSGIGGYFSSTAGYALVTGTGNVGIGTNTPDKAGLVVNKLVGATSAIFGDNAAGVGVDVAWPGISLNGYYNGERKLLTNGYVGGISLDPATGLFRIYNSSSSGVAGAGIAQFDRLLIDNEGDVGIGINNPSASIHVARGTGSGGTAQFLGTTHSSHFNYSTTENTYIRGGKDAANVYINDVAGLGNVAIGNGTPTEKLHVFGNLRVSGTICNTSGTIAACSDIRYKKNFSKIENPLQKVMSINGLHYDWRVDEFKENNFSKERQIGFIAQEIEKIFPEMVYTDEKGYKSVDYSRLTPVLVEAIKELKTLNDQLKVKNERLESNTQKIESRLEKLEALLVK